MLSHREENFSLKSLALLCHISPSYFSRLFTREMGEHFSLYVARMKIGWAKELLATTDWSVNEISNHLNFFAMPAISLRSSKKYESATPLSYRASLKNKSNITSRNNQAVLERQLHIILTDIGGIVPGFSLLQPLVGLMNIPAPRRRPTVEVIREEALRLLLCAEAQQIGQRTGFSIADAGESCAAGGKLLQCAGTVCEQSEQRQDTFPNQLTDLLPGGIQL
ncbi:AraC family transcriptional regulator [Paenibacillus rhizoplanae]